MPAHWATRGYSEGWLLSVEVRWWSLDEPCRPPDTVKPQAPKTVGTAEFIVWKMILLFPRFWGNHVQFQLLDDINSIIWLTTIQAKQLVEGWSFPTGSFPWVVCSSPPFTSAQISRSPSWRWSNLRTMPTIGVSANLLPLWSHQNRPLTSTSHTFAGQWSIYPFCCQLKHAKNHKLY